MAYAVIMSRIGLNEDRNVVGEWHKQEGETVSKGDALFTVETDKSTLTVESEFEGVLLKRFYNAWDSVKVLTPVCVIGSVGEDFREIKPDTDSDTALAEKPPEQETETIASPAMEQQTCTELAELKISPRAKRLAEANGVDIHNIKPSGAENRIIEADIIAAISTPPCAKAAPKQARTQKLSRIRQIISKNMVASLQGSAQLTLNTLFDASKLLEYREKVKQQMASGAPNITVGDIILYVSAHTLAEFPGINARMRGEDEMELFSSVNLGCAVDTDRGLMVPTIFDADTKSLEQISAEVKELAKACREGKMPPDQLQGGTFTVTNLGVLGIRSFTPIINSPQVAILGVGCIDYQAKKTEQGFLFYPGMQLSLTIDHRVVDGAPGAKFLKKLCENLENFTA